jgi:peroxidase
LFTHKLIGIGAACLLVGASVSPSFAQTAPQSTVQLLTDFRPIGGGGNNTDNPSYNAIPGLGERALAPLHFGPGAKDSLVSGPNARTVSNVLAGGTGAQGQTATTTDPGASAWLYVMGQFVDHDLDLESNSPNGHGIDINVPAQDPVFRPNTKINMTRDDRSPATDTIINTAAGYLDLSQVYGSTATVAANLRNSDGTLKTADSTQPITNQTLQIINGNFVTGDPRVMENPELVAVTTLFMREHNYWVKTLKAQNSSWNGDQLYNMAKAITTAEYQNIVYTEFVPLLVGPIDSNVEYDSSKNAQVSQEFAEAAFRMGHSQVSGEQAGIDNNGNEVFSQSLAQAFFNTPEQDIANGINPLLRHLGADPSQATDIYAVDELRNLLFAPLPGGNVDEFDLIAIDIQRERDAGLGTLNQTRQALGLTRWASFDAVTSDAVVRRDLQTIYGNVDNLDLFMGGLAENHTGTGRLGETFTQIIGDQFVSLRKGDRYYWENQGFDTATKSMIASTSLATILRRDTDSTNIQDHVFVPTSSVAQAARRAVTKPTLTTPIITNGRPIIYP